MSQNASNNFLLGDDPHDVYLANAEGFTESGRAMIQEKVLPTLVAGGVAVYEPFREFFARATQKYGKFDLTRPEIVLFGASSNALAIRNAKLVLAVLDGVDVDSGTASEIGFAYACGKPIAGIRTDFR
jgi:nucleoside 2-deoxyribosyltransferase